MAMAVAARGVPMGLDMTGHLWGSVTFVAPFAAGCAAWLAVRRERWGLDNAAALGTRPAHAARGQEVAVGMALSAAGVLLAGVAGAVWLWLVPDAFGAMNWAVVLAAAGGFASFVPLGYGIGRAVPALITPALVAALMLVVNLIVCGYDGRPWTQLLPVTWPTPGIFAQWETAAVAYQALWLVGIGGLLAVIAVARRSSARRLILMGGVTSLVAALGAIGLAPAHSRYYADDVPAYAEACAGTEPEVCVHPAMAPALPELVAQFEPLMVRLEGTAGYATRLQHRQRGRGGQPDPGKRAIHLDRLTRPAVAGVAAEYVEDQLDLKACYTGQGADARPWMSVVYAWLVPGNEESQALVPEAAAAARAWFETLNEAGKRDWLRAHWREFTQCGLGPDQFR
jgi:hypothetical protein